MCMLCFEWWAFELLAIFSGLLSVGDLAAEVVIINIITFIFMIPLGISYSASGLVGSSLGEGNIGLAHRYAVITVSINIILTSIVVLCLGLLQHQVAELFTKEENIVKIVKNAMWVLLIYIWFDTIHGVQSGIIRGLNLQFRGAILTLVCYYVLGMPLALVFAFVCRWGIMGLWAGFTIACVILDIGLFMIIYCPDWQKISDNVKDALKASQHAATNAVADYRVNYTPEN